MMSLVKNDSSAAKIGKSVRWNVDGLSFNSMYSLVEGPMRHSLGTSLNISEVNSVVLTVRNSIHNRL
jgi:hypothetical protein